MPKEKSHEEEQKPTTAPDLPAEFKKPGFSSEEEPQNDRSENAEPSRSKAENKPQDDNVKQVIDSEQTDEAVDDIVRQEGDDLLENQDKSNAVAQAKLKTKKSWWKRSKFWWTVVLLIFIAVGALTAVQSTRHNILNFLGVRVSASVIVLDNTTSQPLKNVTVSIGGTSVNTNSKGEAKLEKLEQGKQKLMIDRIAFSKVEKEVTLGWGSNPLGTYKLKPSGAQYTFIISDYLSGKPIKGAEVSSGKATAASDKDGKAVLTIGQTDESEVPVSVSASGYRTDEVPLKINTKDDVNVALVPGNKAVFAANEGGRFNVYSMYIDGQDRKVLLEGSGNESSDMALSVSTDGSQAVLVSTRENIKGEDGTLLESLTLINVKNGGNKVLDRGAKMELIDWIGTVLIYQMTVPGAADNSKDRQRLISYDYENDKRVALASANQFKTASSAQGDVYFSSDGELNSINPGGGDKKTVLSADVMHAYRTTYDTLILQASDGWYSLSLGSGDSTKMAAPGNTSNRVYVSDQTGDSSLWVDGSVLKSYNLSSGKDSDIVSQSGLSYPVRWLTNTAAVFRVGGADYVVSTQGGDARKVVDVTGTTGVVQTY